MKIIIYMFISAIIAWTIQRIRIERMRKKYEEALKEYRIDHKLFSDELIKNRFRDGDQVYINGDDKFKLGRPYYLISSYIGLRGDLYYYIGDNPGDKRQTHLYATLATNLSFDPPEICDRCHRILETKL